MSVRIVNDGPVPVVVNIWETMTPASDGENVERIDLAPGESTRPIEIRSWSRGVTVMEAIPAEGKPPPALSPRSNLSVAQAPPVDRSQQTLTDGSPVTDDHRELRPDGMQKAYVVLSEEERAKGFVRPVRRTYVHTKCGEATTMALSIAETLARDPGFYSGGFCASCRKHFPNTEFVWKDDGTKVGT